jgi:hypothetical protein
MMNLHLKLKTLIKIAIRNDLDNDLRQRLTDVVFLC